jgi:hypothetical protein
MGRQPLSPRSAEEILLSHLIFTCGKEEGFDGEASDLLSVACHKPGGILSSLVQAFDGSTVALREKRRAQSLALHRHEPSRSQAERG